MNKITELRQETSELKDDLARVMKEMESNLVMTETVTLPSQVELKQLVDVTSGSHGSSNIFVSCSLLVHHQHQSQALSPAATKRTMARSPMKYHRCFVRQCRVIVQVIGKTIAAI